MSTTLTLVETLIGQSKENALSTLNESGYKVRVIYVGGPPQLLTCDHNPGRVTIEVKEGHVISAQVG